MAEQVQLEGLAELRRTLRRLPKDLQKRELRNGLRKGAKVIQELAQGMAPVDTGLLRDSIVIRSEKKRYLNDAARLKVGVASKKKKKGEDNTTPYYWRFIEFGYVRKNGTHVPGRSFMVKAFEIGQGAAFRVIMEHYKKAIQRITKRLAKT